MDVKFEYLKFNKFAENEWFQKYTSYIKHLVLIYGPHDKPGLCELHFEKHAPGNM